MKTIFTDDIKKEARINEWNTIKEINEWHGIWILFILLQGIWGYLVPLCVEFYFSIVRYSSRFSIEPDTELLQLFNNLTELLT